MRYWGFNDDPGAHIAQGPFCQQIGANAGRMMCWWSEPTNSPAQDKAAAAMRARGITPILHLSTQSVMDPTAYAAKIGAAAAHWPECVIEAVNEVNYPGFFLDPKTGKAGTPAQAAAVNDAAALAAPGRVLGSSVAPMINEDYFGYHDEMYGRMKHRDKLLGVSVHFYPPWYDPVWQLKRAIDRASKWGKVWITEWNLHGGTYNGSSKDRPAQAPTSAKLVTLMDKDPRVECGLWHRLTPGPGFEDDERPGKIWATQNGPITYALWAAFKIAKASP